MKIAIKQEYKSIKQCEFDLPNFSLLTGKNGSGKSHLLQAISNPNISTVTINGVVTKNFRYIKFNELNPYIQESCDPTEITTYTKKAWEQYKTALQYSSSTHSVNLQNILRHVGDENIRRFITKVSENTESELHKLTEDNFADNFDISFMKQADFFTAQFALIFKDYHKKQDENEYNAFRQSKGEPVLKPILAKSEFLEKYGEPPWELINKILVETNIPYQVNNPVGTRGDSSFVFKLIDHQSNIEISSNDLSTGEKVLMSLALAIYNTGVDFGKPDLLLIDEPDAGLHPAMSKMMVDVLNNHIVNNNHISVIISTHSPTTVIASEGIAIYQVIRGNSVPQKIPVQDAVEILTSDIPFLKISTEKRRQVFVENQNDVSYYELITNIYSRLETLPSEPVYISTRKSKHEGSNCSDVKAIVQSLSASGSNTVYGIIDRDRNNEPEGKILVLGDSERYAIENYLLDPFLMGLLFIREAKLKPINFGITAFDTYADVDKLNAEDAPKIINKILQDLGLYSTDLTNYKLCNGWTLNISLDFNNYQGHDLEDLYKRTYPFLNAYNKEEMLKKDIINKVINDYPLLAPVGIIETIKKIV